MERSERLITVHYAQFPAHFSAEQTQRYLKLCIRHCITVALGFVRR